MNICQSGVLSALFGCYMAGPRRNCCHFGAFCLQHTMSLHTKPHTHGACVFSCDLPSAFLAEWPQDCLHANMVTGLVRGGGGGGGGTES